MFSGIIPKLILWHGFIESIQSPERAKQESCAWIFADLQNQVWHIAEVKNIGLKEKSIEYSFSPDRKDFARVKRKAKKYGFTRIGCIHTHVIIGDNEKEIKNQSRPSDIDIIYAKKFNDIIRAIIVVQFSHIGEKGKVRDLIWFDQYGNILED